MSLKDIIDSRIDNIINIFNEINETDKVLPITKERKTNILHDRINAELKEFMIDIKGIQ